MMKIFILTGGIGSGKSTAGSILRELGAVVIEADSLAKQVLDPGTPGFTSTVEIFGQDILTDQKRIDRVKLGRIVFRNPDALRKLNKIIHPEVDRVVEGLLQEYEKQGVKTVFIEMAVLAEAEAPFMSRVVGVWLVKSSKDVILDRLKNRGLDKEEVLARMANQPSVEEQIKDKLTVIVNDEGKDELKTKIRELWDLL